MNEGRIKTELPSSSSPLLIRTFCTSAGARRRRKASLAVRGTECAMHGNPDEWPPLSIMVRREERHHMTIPNLIRTRTSHSAYSRDARDFLPQRSSRFHHISSLGFLLVDHTSTTCTHSRIFRVSLYPNSIHRVAETDRQYARKVVERPLPENQCCALFRVVFVCLLPGESFLESFEGLS